jgi:hypothetical protein
VPGAPATHETAEVPSAGPAPGLPFETEPAVRHEPPTLRVVPPPVDDGDEPLGKGAAAAAGRAASQTGAPHAGAPHAGAPRPAAEPGALTGTALTCTALTGTGTALTGTGTAEPGTAEPAPADPDAETAAGPDAVPVDRPARSARAPRARGRASVPAWADVLLSTAPPDRSAAPAEDREQR